MMKSGFFYQGLMLIGLALLVARGQFPLNRQLGIIQRIFELVVFVSLRVKQYSCLGFDVVLGHQYLEELWVITLSDLDDRNLDDTLIPCLIWRSPSVISKAPSNYH